MEKIKYHLNYEKYYIIDGVGGYILKEYTSNNMEDIKKYIKENITEKDNIKSLWKITKEKINIK